MYSCQLLWPRLYTIFDLEEIKDECINHKLILKMALGAFLLIKPQKYVFSPHQKSRKKRGRGLQHNILEIYLHTLATK